MRNGVLKRKKRMIDPWLTATVFLLTGIGFLALGSATAGDGVSSRLKVQLLATAVGVALAAVVARLDINALLAYKKWLYVACVLVLAFVLLFGSGKEQTGANSWIRLGPVGIQPSEPIKVVFALIFGETIAGAQKAQRLNTHKNLLGIFAAFSVICGLVILQNDTGTALVFAFMFCLMLFAGGLKKRYFGIAFGVALATVPVIWWALAPYQKNRIIVFLRPETDPAGAGYQVLQSKLSVASGGVFGRGYMQGRNNRLSLLPEKETDFIFGVIGEEFGFIGCMVVVLLLFFLCLRCFHIAQSAKDGSAGIICVGLGAMFLFHAVENISMCIGLLPVTGIPLPFLSYGGSAQVTSYLAIGLLQNLYAASYGLRGYHKQ